MTPNPIPALDSAPLVHPFLAAYPWVHAAFAWARSLQSLDERLPRPSWAFAFQHLQRATRN